MLSRLSARLALAFACLITPMVTSLAAETQRVLTIRTNDVIAFVGGADVVAASFPAHLESLLAVRFPGARFRNFGWEGDTVFSQPREVGFPSLPEQLRRAQVTVVCLQFGRTEALTGKATVPEFYAAYEKLVSTCAPQTARIVLVTPPPFERGESSLPDLSQRNTQLAAHANAIRTLVGNRSLYLIDLFAALGGVKHDQPRLTDNGLQLTPRGHALVAAAFLRELGADQLATQPGEPTDTGAWPEPRFEKLRQTAMEKNQLWFNYWRPQNWAFLGGDRITQPSSRDHRDPKVRWFPAEMEKYRPLIQAKEAEMEKVAAQVRGGTR
jgi:hypothetical protein